jgi:uncharacterized membrane protein YedE/YeeE
MRMSRLLWLTKFLLGLAIGACAMIVAGLWDQRMPWIAAISIAILVSLFLIEERRRRRRSRTEHLRD